MQAGSCELLNRWDSITLPSVLWDSAYRRSGSFSLCLPGDRSSAHHSLSSAHSPVSSLAVSISDVETIRKGHDSELLRYLVDEFPLEQGFTIVFHGRRPNLDLVANSVEEAQIWMRGLQLLVDLVASMNYQEQLDQYQPDGVRVWLGY